MKSTTKEIHDSLEYLGKKMGFIAHQEVSDSLLSLSARDDTYTPRIDLMWSLEIDNSKREAIAEVTGELLDNVKHLPIVGIEVEGSGPTTKTLMADIANLRTLGAPLGLLVVDEHTEAGQYRRASRVIRTVQRNLGDFTVIPMEGAMPADLAKQKWDSTPSEIEIPRRTTARGGEKTKWTAQIRRYLIELGERAGFVVAEPYRLPAPEARFAAERTRRIKPMREMWDPFKRELHEMTRGSHYMTQSEIDMAWLLPLPRSLTTMLQKLAKFDPTLIDHDLVYPDAWNQIPVVGFELDTNPGKHGGGGLLNLSAYSVLGVMFTPNDVTTKSLTATLKTYGQALGLRNVYVRTAP